MKSMVAVGSVFRFGLFEANPASSTQTRSGIQVRIQDQPFQLLMLLLDRPGEIVTRDELRRSLWPEGTYVDFDGSLNVILKRLRAALDDDPDNPRFIQTVPRCGYRFIAPVSIIEKSSEKEPLRSTPLSAQLPEPPELAPSAPAAVSAGASGTKHRKLFIYAGSALVLVIAIGAWPARGTRKQISLPKAWISSLDRIKK